MIACLPIYCTLMTVFLQSFYFHKTCFSKNISEKWDILLLWLKQKILLYFSHSCLPSTDFPQVPMPHFFSEVYFEYHRQLLSSFGCPKSGGNSGEKCRCWAIPQCYFQSRTTARKPSHPPWASLSLSLSARIEQYVFLTPQFHGYYLSWDSKIWPYPFEALEEGSQRM